MVVGDVHEPAGRVVGVLLSCLGVDCFPELDGVDVSLDGSDDFTYRYPLHPVVVFVLLVPDFLDQGHPLNEEGINQLSLRLLLVLVLAHP